ncbi:MAG: peptide ABC transporter permease [Blastopirellula sp.]|nr:MAG: peptide ABC transporter permease [Blastopirellula sp.]
MLSYLIRRILIGLLTLLFITFFVYGLIRNMPGTPLTLEESTNLARELTEEDANRLAKHYGLDKPWYEGYSVWLSRVVQFDLGRSIPKPYTVTELISERLPATLLLSGSSLFLTYLLSIPLGLFSTATKDSYFERGLGLFLYMLYSLPAFVAALYLQILFHQKLGWLPLANMVTDISEFKNLTLLEKTWDVTLHSILPVFCFTYGSLAYYTRFVKSNMIEVEQQDYIRTAKAKGVHPFKILVVHAFRNTLVPLVTLVGLTLPALLSGAVILEQIFAWPGMGSLFFESIDQRDYDTTMGLVLMFSVMTLLGQLLADVLYAVVDPRITYD